MALVEPVDAAEALRPNPRFIYLLQFGNGYRHPGSSEPHVSTLIQLTLFHFARYSDALRGGGPPISDHGRYPLSAMINAQSIEELSLRANEFRSPGPEAVWNARGGEFINWLPLLSFKFPSLNVREDAVVRLSRSYDLPGLEPVIAAGSWMLLKPLDSLSNIPREREKSGWSRPLYMLRRGLHFVAGYLEQDGSDYALVSNVGRVPTKERLARYEASSLHRVTGVAVPV